MPKLTGFGLGTAKYISPVLAAILHVTGSLVVVFNSFRIVRYGEELEPYEPVVNYTEEAHQPHHHHHP